MKSGLLALVSAVLLTLLAIPANAQATRTWVSGVGDDANPCSRTAPCKTFAGAISKTAAPGEINCIDPGGFGAVTITKSVAIICNNVEAGVLVSGTNGINVTAAATDVVYLEGLDFEGLNASPSGVAINTAAAVHLVNCRFRGFTTAGVNVANTSGFVAVDVIDSVVADNPGASAFGILIKPTAAGSARVQVERTRVTNNGSDGIAVNANATSGSVKATVRDSDTSNNLGNGLSVFSSSGIALAVIDSTTLSNNGTGIGVTGSNASAYFTRSTIVANTTGVSGTTTNALSYQTNAVIGNGTPGTFGTTSQQ